MLALSPFALIAAALVQGQLQEDNGPGIQRPDEGAFELALTPAVPRGDVRLRWSPKGAQLPLERVPRSASRKDALRTTLTLGALDNPLRPRELVLIPAEEDGGPMRLQITVGPDRGALQGVPPERITLHTPLGDEAPLSAERQVITLEAQPSASRGKTWYSWEYTPMLNDQRRQPSVPDDGPATQARADVRAYPISLWYVVDPNAAPDAEPVLRWSRRGWHEAHFEWQGQHAALLVCDMQMDGLFDERDAWSMELLGPLGGEGGKGGRAQAPDDLGRSAPAPEAAEATGGAPWQTRATSRPMTRHVWLGEEAFRLIHITPHGERIRLEPFDPGMTRAEEAALDDAYAADRRAERAPAPLAFGHDFEAAEALAKREGRPLFIDFETTWCGPCKQMDALVYTAKSVVDAAAAANVVAVKVDGDERPDLVERFAVGAYPTLVFVDSEGAEQARRVGYQSVAETSALLQALNRVPVPAE